MFFYVFILYILSIMFVLRNSCMNFIRQKIGLYFAKTKVTNFLKSRVIFLLYKRKIIPKISKACFEKGYWSFTRALQACQNDHNLEKNIEETHPYCSQSHHLSTSLHCGSLPV